MACPGAAFDETEAMFDDDHLFALSQNLR